MAYVANEKIRFWRDEPLKRKQEFPFEEALIAMGFHSDGAFMDGMDVGRGGEWEWYKPMDCVTVNVTAFRKTIRIHDCLGGVVDFPRVKFKRNSPTLKEDVINHVATQVMLAKMGVYEYASEEGY